MRPHILAIFIFALTAHTACSAPAPSEDPSASDPQKTIDPDDLTLPTTQPPTTTPEEDRITPPEAPATPKIADDLKPSENPTTIPTFDVEPAYRRGYSLFTPDANTHSHMRRKVCDADCFAERAERAIREPRGMAVSGALHHGLRSEKDLRAFDRFTYPNAERPWHREAQALTI